MSERPRPDPDALLAKVQREEAKAKRGKLKIFFGATAGVGKTYAMLQEARQLKARGVDVVVGYVEPHGSAETEALLEGLECCRTCPSTTAARRCAISTSTPRWRASPALLLVDELAHSNPVKANRDRATQSAGRTSRSCSRPASTSTPRSTCSTSRA